MQLRDFLLSVATTYDRHASMSSPAQILLKSAKQELAEHAPGGIIVEGSGGKGIPTHSPWIGFFDPDETTTPQAGVYVVYLFAADLGSVALSLNQGMTRLTEELGVGAARNRLSADADAIRGVLDSKALVGLSRSLDLGTAGFRQQAYEAGNIAAVRYSLSNLPPETKLRRDLAHLLDLYQDAIAAKRHLLQSSPGTIATSSVQQFSSNEDPLLNFQPKDDADYVARIRGRTMVKTRRHETLVRQFGEWAQTQGFKCSTTEHPIDLMLRRDGQAWLVEVEIVRQGSATSAVREAVGQLLEYRHFLFLSPPVPSLVALFSEPIGGAFSSYLASLGIIPAWKDGEHWTFAEVDFGKT